MDAVTDAVMEDVRAWQAGPLEAVYPIAYLDAIHVKLRVAGHVQNQAVYLALAINLEGQKELLGLWVGGSGGEGAKFWLSVLTELTNRGLQDILIAAVDGLKGFPNAIEAVFPKTQVQLCIVEWGCQICCANSRFITRAPDPGTPARSGSMQRSSPARIGSSVRSLS